MIQLRIRIPGQEAAIVTVEGDQAVIGRAPECEAALPLQHVSKRHVKILVGVVLADLASRNGVWIAGRKLEEPCLLGATPFQLGADPEKSPEIELLQATSSGTQVDRFALVEAEKRRLEQRIAELEAELAQKSGDEGGEAREREQARRTQAWAPPGAQPGPAPAAPPRAGRIPSFDDFFRAAKPQPPAAAPDRSGAKGAPRVGSPAPAVPASYPALSRDEQRQRIVEMINRLIAEDVGGKPPMIEGPVDEFFTLESFRLLRKVEQVITYLARDMVQLYDVKTMLPSSEGNFRSLAAEVLLDPEDRVARQKLVEYLEDLRKWMSVALTANRKAAQQLVRNLKQELSAEALTASEPMPALVKALGRADGELWRRAQVYLRELSDDIVDERVELQARKIAGEMLEQKSPA